MRQSARQVMVPSPSSFKVEQLELPTTRSLGEMRLRRSIKEFMDRDNPIQRVPAEHLRYYIRSLLCWMVGIAFYLLFLWQGAWVAHALNVSKPWFHGVALVSLTLLMLWRCVGTSGVGNAGHQLYASCSVGLALPGTAMVLFGLVSERMLHDKIPAVGSILEAPSMMKTDPPPGVFFFSDGFVALNLTVTGHSCWKKKGTGDDDEYCYHYSMAPVFANYTDAAGNVKAIVRAWAVPRGSGTLVLKGTVDTIPTDTCKSRGDHKNDDGGLCGVDRSAEVRQHGVFKDIQLTRLFVKNNPLKSVPEDVPFICFIDPDEYINGLWACWEIGLVLIAMSLLMTCFQVRKLYNDIPDDPTGGGSRCCRRKAEDYEEYEEYDDDDSSEYESH